ncbi:CapA family protein [Flavobacterium sp. MAH-1]|uniref:CapA family protein n=1 Tax=Flavobacterium agri TaxID=2743471 RepID=A0A7Y8Y1X0_9FLAO|nr:CapA family protein [Flavobacterium agri]NUY80876.1 CapA family protein [Flavobacterium agri]NYA70900.1 CapA family protein [Flavobacterium agri]
MSVKIVITGDFCPINRNQGFIDNNDFDSVFGSFSPISKSADLAITNLECPLTETNNPIEKSGPCIKSKPNAIEALKFAGFNLATLANNHIMDFGSEGLKSTLDVCKKANIETVGADRNLSEARKPFTTTINGIKIGVLNFAENEFCTTTGDEYGANPLNPVSNFYDISETKKQVDFLIVIVHGGREHYELPSPRVRENFRFFADAGADAVVSHHTHCFSGYETWNGKPIFYGLGNFIFDYKKKYQKGKWTEGYAVEFGLDNGKLGFEIIPYKQGREEKSTLELLSESERKDFDSRLEALNETIADDKKFGEAWQNYLKTQKDSYKALLFVQNKYVRALMAKKLFPKLFFQSESHKNVVLNLFKCETHREIMIETLNKKID